MGFKPRNYKHLSARIGRVEDGSRVAPGLASRLLQLQSKK